MDVQNNIISNFMFKVDSSALKSISSTIDTFKKELGTMSAPDLFNVKDSLTSSLQSANAELTAATTRTQILSNELNKVKLNSQFGKELKATIAQNKLEVKSMESSIGELKNKLSAVNSATQQFGGSREQFNLISAAAQKSGREFSEAEIAMRRLNLVALDNGMVMNKATGEVMTMNKAVNITSKSLIRFNMSLLSVLFTGMALQRVTGQFLRSAITTYQKANEETQGLGKATWELQAAWEFFKYSLVDALTNSELFKSFITILMNVVKWLNKLSPTQKAWIAMGIGVMFVIGTLMVLIGTFGLFINALQMLSVKSLISFGGLILIISGVILVIAGVYYAIQGVREIVNNWGKDWDAVISGIGKVMLGLISVIAGVGLIVAGIFLMMGMTGAAAAVIVWVSWAFIAIVIIGLIAILVVKIIQHWVQIKKFFAGLVLDLQKDWAYFKFIVMYLVLTMAKFIIDIYLWMYEKVANFIDLIAKGFVYLWYGIKKGSKEMVGFVLDSIGYFAEKTLSFLEGIPGLGSIISSLRSGIDKVKSGLDDWGTSIESTKNKALDMIDSSGAVKSINALKDVSDQYFNNAISNIYSERDASISAAQQTYNEKIKLYNAEIAARQEANKKIINESKKDSLLDKITPKLGLSNSSLLDGLNSEFLGNMDLGKLTSDTGKTEVIDNSTNNYNINIPETLTNQEDIAKYVMEQIDDMLSRKLDSVNT